MSLLLDALNKADQERKRNEATPGINSNHELISDKSGRNKSLLIAVIVLGIIMLLATIYWLGQRSATPVTSTPIAQKDASTSPASNQTRAGAVKGMAATTQDIHTTEDNINSDVDASNLTTNNVNSSEESVATLYQQNSQTQNANATLTLSTPSADTPAVQDAPAAQSATPPNSTQPEQVTAAPISITQFANLPDLHDLPTQVLEKIPSLNYSEHNYNSIGGNVKINGNIYHANDALAGDLVIDKILQDGMILHAGNYSFKMRALNSWVNM